MELQSTVAIITGAGGAIGRATALLFAGEGAALALVDLKKEAVEETAALVRGSGGRALTFALDVSEEQDIIGMVQTTTTSLGPPAIVVNNAAISMTTPIIDTTAADWDRVMAVNLRSVFLLSREALRVMQPLRRG